MMRQFHDRSLACDRWSRLMRLGLTLLPGLWIIVGQVTAEQGSVPDPPLQGTDWAKPESPGIPVSWLNAAEVLIASGLADPRGCEYREIDVRIGNAFRQHQRPGHTSHLTTSTHGWVLPSSPDGDGQRYAVCWNGWVYPVTRVEDKASLPADVRAMIEDPPHGWSERNRRRLFQGDIGSIASDRFHPVTIVLLLLLGEEELASDLYTVWAGLLDGEFKNDREDPFGFFAGAWLQDGMMSLTNAFCSGEDAIAGQRCAILSQAENPLREAFVERRQEDAVHTELDDPPLHVIDPATSIRVDLQRRAKDPDQPRQPDWRTLTPEAFAAHLEHATDANFEEMESAALAIGGPLAPQLIACLKDDDRLSRRRAGPDYPFGQFGALPVSGLAFQLLTELLQTRRFGTDRDFYFWESRPSTDSGFRYSKAPEERRRLTKIIETYWDHHGSPYRSHPVPERWYEILKDDKAGEDRWLQAAKDIVGTSMSKKKTVNFFLGRRPEGRKTIAGETLRTKQSPSVTDLIARQAARMCPNPLADAASVAAMRRSWELMQIAQTWEPRRAAQLIEDHLKHCRRLWDSEALGQPPGRAPAWVIRELKAAGR